MDKINPFKESKEEPKDKKNRRNILIVVCILVVVVLFLFIIEPAILGLEVYQDESSVNLTGLNEEVQLLRQELQQRDAQAQTVLQSSLDKKSAELTQCFADKAVLEGEKASVEGECAMYEEKITSLETQLAEKEAALEEAKTANDDEILELQDQIKTIENSYEELISYMANNICCKQKVDNRNINYYAVEGNKTICKESEGTQLSCFS